MLIVGGGLLAGLLAVRVDAREPVLAAARDIAAGALITSADLREVQVASDGLQLISKEQASQILDGNTYAKAPIQAESLVDQNMLTKVPPVGEGRAVIAVPLDPSLAPSDALRSGDLVQVVRISGAQGDGKPVVLTEGLVLTLATAAAGDLGASQTGSVNLLVPSEVAPAVIDAAGSDLAGLALLEHGVSTDVDLQVGEG